jgi:hypothetical protein
MGSLAVIPQWVTPAVQQVEDYHRLAYAGARETGSALMGGHSAAVGWLTSSWPAPVTSRDDPVTEQLVRVERMLATAVESGRSGLHPGLWAEFGVAPREPVKTDRDWCRGAALALGWLTGVHDRPTLRLPRRLPDRSTPTADDLYDEAVAARPHAAWLPEQQRGAWAQAEHDAALYRRLAALAASAW